MTVPAPYLPSGMTPSKVSVVEGVVFRRDGEAFLPSDLWKALSDRPGLQHTVNFQAEVVMERGRIVLLDNKDWVVSCGSGVRHPPSFLWWSSGLLIHGSGAAGDKGCPGLVD